MDWQQKKILQAKWVMVSRRASLRGTINFWCWSRCHTGFFRWHFQSLICCTVSVVHVFLLYSILRIVLGCFAQLRWSTLYECDVFSAGLIIIKAQALFADFFLRLHISHHLSHRSARFIYTNASWKIPKLFWFNFTDQRTIIKTVSLAISTQIPKG